MIIEKLNDYYLSLTKRERKGYFYCTDVARCPRDVYYEMSGHKGEEESAKGMRRMRAGSHSHLRLLSDLHSAGVRVVASELSIPENELIHGRCDCIINDGKDDMVIDFKTSGDYGFNLLKEGNGNKDHELQVQLYLHFFQKQWGLIIYENKNDNELLEIPVEYNKELCEQALQNLKELKQKIDNKILPAIPQDIQKWKCSYCRFKKKCEEDEKKVSSEIADYLKKPLPNNRPNNQNTL